MKHHTPLSHPPIPWLQVTCLEVKERSHKRTSCASLWKATLGFFYTAAGLNFKVKPGWAQWKTVGSCVFFCFEGKSPKLRFGCKGCLDKTWDMFPQTVVLMVIYHGRDITLNKSKSSRGHYVEHIFGFITSKSYDWEHSLEVLHVMIGTRGTVIIWHKTQTSLAIVREIPSLIPRQKGWHLMTPVRCVCL